MKGSAIAFIFFASAFLFVQPMSAVDEEIETVFHSGEWEGTAGGVFYFSPFGATRHRPTINYATLTLSAGEMITGLNDWGLLRGNLEMVGEIFGGGLFEGEGHYLTGLTIWPRYNFVQPGWKLVPYAQVGAGVTATDIDQHLVGQVFNFNLEAAAGGRYFLRHDLALNAEYRYQHISNANTGERNVGVNSQGVWLGVSWFF